MVLRYGKASDVGMSEEKIKYVESLLPKWIEQDITPAFVGILARRGQIVFHKACGNLKYGENATPMTLDAIFPLCSITKPITAVAAMILVEDGLLSLHRPVSWYIPEFTGEGKNDVFVHQLLTHTSGLRDDVIAEHCSKKDDPPADMKVDDTQHPDLARYLHKACDTPLWIKPGQRMAYCNFNMILLGEIIRRVSGKSLEDFYSERIFKPLGMNDTHIVVPRELWDRAVEFPEDSDGYGRLSTEKSFLFPSAAGGCYSTVYDMAIFGQMILNKGIYNGVRILSPLTVEEMTHDRIPGISAVFNEEYLPEASWGLGWNVFKNKLDLESGPLASEAAFGHGGYGRCMFWIDPVYEVVGMIFYVKMEPEYRRPDDLFRNAIMSAIYE